MGGPAYRRRRSTRIRGKLRLLADDVQRLQTRGGTTPVHENATRGFFEESRAKVTELITVALQHSGRWNCVSYMIAIRLSCRGVLDRTIPQTNAPDEKFSC
jgi:hypothetical protein